MDNIFWESATKYLSNEATDEDINRLLELIEKDDRYLEMYEDLAERWNRFEAFEQTISDNPVNGGYFQNVSKSKPRQQIQFSIEFRFLAGFTALLGLILVTFVTYHFLELSDQQTVRTAPGEILKLRLSDSTVVWLNSKSSLTYNFSKAGPRWVRLRGQASFNVQNDVSRPFIVQGGFFETMSTVTRFSMDTRWPAPFVGVQSGAVLVTDPTGKSEIKLENGQKASYDSELKRIRVETSAEKEKKEKSPVF